MQAFLESTAAELAEGRSVDLGENFGVLSVKLRTPHLQEGSPRTPKNARYQVVFRESKRFKQRLKVKPVDRQAGQYSVEGRCHVGTIQSNDLGLLDILAAKVGCVYLSDLKQTQSLPHIRHVLRKIKPSAFSLREWNNAVSYLTGKETPFESAEEAVEYLLGENFPTTTVNGKE